MDNRWQLKSVYAKIVDKFVNNSGFPAANNVTLMETTHRKEFFMISIVFHLLPILYDVNIL